MIFGIMKKEKRMNEKINHKELLHSTLNHNAGNDKLVLDIDLFLCNTCLPDKDKTRLIERIDQAYMTGNAGSRDEIADDCNE